MTSRFYALTLVLATGLGGIVLPPDQPFVNAQTQTNQPRKAEADRLLDLGTQQYKLSQFEPALKSWQQALVIYQEIKDRQKEGRLQGNLGKTYESLGRYVHAIASHRQSLAIAKELGDRRSEGESLINLGGGYRALGN